MAVNTTNVAAQQRRRLFTRALGSLGLPAHAALILPPWILFLRSLGGIPTGQMQIGERAARRWGALLAAAGIALSLAGFKELGLGGLVNQDQFSAAPRRSTSGIYRLFTDPIYVGLFAGDGRLGHSPPQPGRGRRKLAEGDGMTQGLALALEMLLLIPQVEGRVEARALGRRPL